MPDLTLSFINPRLLDDVSFHPCIRLKRWENERILSFMPPDGSYRLLTYQIPFQSTGVLPLYVKPQVSFISGSSGRFDLTIGQKANYSKNIENVVATVQMPPQVLSCNLQCSVGNQSFDPVKKVLRWDIGKMNPQKTALPNMRGNILLNTGAPPPEESPVITLEFRIPQTAISGLRVNRLDIYGEKYKPFKGVKYATKAGKFQVRTWLVSIYNGIKLYHEMYFLVFLLLRLVFLIYM